MRVMLIGVLAVAACGASSANRQAAIDAQYQTEFATVWNALATEVNERFPDGIRTEDATVGFIETKWRPVDFEQDSTSGDSDAVNNVRSKGVGSRNMFRLTARIEPGGPPWKVVIDGEAALYRPNMTMLQPYRHGAIDEPQWVPGRIERVRNGLYDRLKQYAVAVPKGKTP